MLKSSSHKQGLTVLGIVHTQNERHSLSLWACDTTRSETMGGRRKRLRERKGLAQVTARNRTQLSWFLAQCSIHWTRLPLKCIHCSPSVSCLLTSAGFFCLVSHKEIWFDLSIVKYLLVAGIQESPTQELDLHLQSRALRQTIYRQCLTCTFGRFYWLSKLWWPKLGSLNTGYWIILDTQ